MHNWSFIKSIIETFQFHIGYALVVFLSMTLYRRWKQYQQEKRFVRQEQAELFISILSGSQKNNSFLVEQAFENKFDYPLSYREIDFFLKFPNATEMIRDYISGRSFFRFDLEMKRPEFTKKYKSKFILWWQKMYYLVLYFGLGMSSLLSISLHIIVMRDYGPIAFLFTVSLGVYVMFLALYNLSLENRLRSAQNVDKYINQFRKKQLKFVY